MALGEIPPWLNVGPGDYLRALQAGTSAGLERRRLSDEEAAQSERQSEFQQQLGESKAERDLRMQLAQRAQDVAQNRFNVTTGLRQQAQDLHTAQFGLAMQRADANQELRRQQLDQELEFHKEELKHLIRGDEIRQEANDLRRQAEKKKNDEGPTVSVTKGSPSTGDSTRYTGKMNDPVMKRLMNPPAAAPAPASKSWWDRLWDSGTSTPAKSTKTASSDLNEGEVKVKSPSDGKIYALPKEQLEEAKRQGFTEVQ